jgi:hypothetical protein
VAIFGRNTARQRLRRATRESLKIPAFSSPVDCAPWVTGGLWPAELSTVTADTAPLVKYLKADLQKIVNSANEELLGIRRAGLADAVRQAEEARVINGARAFAVRRVESTVRHLRNTTPKLPAEHRPLKAVNGTDDTEKTRRFKVVPVAQTETDELTDRPAPPLPTPPPPEFSDHDHHEAPVVDLHDSWTEPVAAAEWPAPGAELDWAEPERSTPRHAVESDDTEVLEEIATVLQEIAPLADTPLEHPRRQPAPAGPPQTPVEEPPPQPATGRHAEPPVPEVLPAREVPPAAAVVEEVATAQPSASPAEAEAQRERLERLLKFVARQEPGLRWAIGNRADGTTVLVTDLAHGWIPPGITLPADVRLLEPARRAGNAAALLGQTAVLATYAPGDPLGWASDYDVTDTSSQPRELPAVEDLGWLLSEATHWRDGLPRMVHTLAKAGAGGTGVIDAEIDILRVYLDTSRYQLFAMYPDIDSGLLLNCLLLAATEGIAAGNLVNANYHFAWFQMLSAPAASGWKAGP